MWFQMAGYELVHHGEGRWNGVAIASRGSGPTTSSRTSATGRSATAARARRGLDEDDFNPFDEARMLSRRLRRGPARLPLRPERPRRRQPVLRRQAGSGSSGFARWLDETRSPDEPLVLAGDYNVTPADEDVWDPRQGATAGRTSRSRSARRSPRLRDWGLVDGYRVANPDAPGASRGGTTGPGCSTATRACGSTCSTRRRRSRQRIAWSRDRPRGAQGAAGPVRPRPGRARPRRAGKAFDAGWEGALARIAARTRTRREPRERSAESGRLDVPDGVPSPFVRGHSPTFMPYTITVPLR